jgi:hypothetical protein
MVIHTGNNDINSSQKLSIKNILRVLIVFCIISMIGEEGASDVFGRNSMRLVEAWLDDYKV